jgi:hypothetical protein
VSADERRDLPGPLGRDEVVLELGRVPQTASARFRNEVVVGNGGKQVLLEDPSGNPIELFEPFGRTS